MASKIICQIDHDFLLKLILFCGVSEKMQKFIVFMTVNNNIIKKSIREKSEHRMKLSNQLVELQWTGQQKSVKFGNKQRQMSSREFSLCQEKAIIVDYSLKQKDSIQKKERIYQSNQSNSTNQFIAENMIEQSSSVRKLNRNQAAYLIFLILNRQILPAYQTFYQIISSKAQVNPSPSNMQLQIANMKKSYKLRKYEPEQNSLLRKITEKDQQNEETQSNSHLEQATKKLFSSSEFKENNHPVHRLRNKSIVGKPSKPIERKEMFGSSWYKKYKNKTNVNEEPFCLQKQTNSQQLPIAVFAIEKQSDFTSAINDTSISAFDIFSELVQTFQAGKTPKCKPIISFGLETIKFKNELIKQKQKFQHVNKQISSKLSTTGAQTTNSSQLTGKKVVKIRAKIQENFNRYQRQESILCCFSGCGGGQEIPTKKSQKNLADAEKQTDDKQKSCNWSFFGMLASQIFTSEQIKNSIASTNIKSNSFQQDNFINDSQIKMSSCFISSIQNQRPSFSLKNKNKLQATKLHRRFDQNQVNRAYNSNRPSPNHYQFSNKKEIKHIRKQNNNLNFSK